MFELDRRGYGLGLLDLILKFLERRIHSNDSAIRDWETGGKRDGGNNTFPRMMAPANLSLDTTNASFVGVQLTIANDPAVVGIS